MDLPAVAEELSRSAAPKTLLPAAGMSWPRNRATAGKTFLTAAFVRQHRWSEPRLQKPR